MKKWIAIPALLVLFGILLRPAFGQVVHGINWSWPAITTDTAGNTIAVDGYNMYCGTAEAGPFVKVNAALIATPNFLESGLTVGSTYFCQYTAVKGTFETAHSPTSAGVPFQFPPVAPGQAPSGVIQ
jgi:hypothetical protein